MNLKITNHSSYRRLRRIERYAMVAHQRLLDRAITEFDRHDLSMPAIRPDVRSLGCAEAICWMADQYWGYEKDEFRNLIMGGEFGIRIAKIYRRAELLDDALCAIVEEEGCREGSSAADCAAWSADREARADWECRHMERWTGD